eukprot:5587302-Amphidinium_carterae.1
MEVGHALIKICGDVDPFIRLSRLDAHLGFRSVCFAWKCWKAFACRLSFPRQNDEGANALFWNFVAMVILFCWVAGNDLEEAFHAMSDLRGFNASATSTRWHRGSATYVCGGV